jgi:hypothetical protein
MGSCTVQKTRHIFLSSFSYYYVKQKVREKARLSFRLFDNEKSTNFFLSFCTNLIIFQGNHVLCLRQLFLIRKFSWSSFSCWIIFQSRKLYRPPTWQWEVDTGMAKSLEIPQTSTINAATHSTQNPLVDRFSIYKHRPHCHLLHTEPRRGQFTIMTPRYCPAIFDRCHNWTQKPLQTALKIVVFPLPCGPLSELQYSEWPRIRTFTPVSSAMERAFYSEKSCFLMQFRA